MVLRATDKTEKETRVQRRTEEEEVGAKAINIIKYI